MATGKRDGLPFITPGRSNSSAGPPSGRFMTRSAISQSSRLTDTGWLIRTSSPARSSWSTKAESVSMLTLEVPVDSRLGAYVYRHDSESHRPPPHVRESDASHARRQLPLDRKT